MQIVGNAQGSAFAERAGEKFGQTTDQLETLQINVGLKCNLSCKHCHVQAGPTRTESMGREVMQACLDVIDAYGFTTLDITGGAPEMNPHLEWLLVEAAQRDITVMLRCNLVILSFPEYAHFAELYARHGVQIVASLPHYVQKNSEAQRGSGTYAPGIEILQKLNSLGYGEGDGLVLNLVYNPGGAFLPSSQDQLEREYKKRLHDQFGIGFDNLFAITNNPLGRFAEALAAKGTLQAYRDKLAAAFNPATLPAMMCRNQLSVDHEGLCYDCDFNQAAQQPCLDGRTIFDYRDAALAAASGDMPGLRRRINFGDHCFACCAGSGSSCGGATAGE
ncbi:MAG: arsenosugar biosynthesis radical SAM protein ArsS [Eggerthellaceae bacterium]|nr:arsenosugar biosynthesis radical SAM protein ArsS [Eggerthellaceae bacterium]MDR2716086.1 arsenosugar biosynthesis radical SAM protein ArsS [Coriobacteriaceae bacterium]